MLFNSIEFAIFLPIVFLIYWFLLSTNVKYQNIFLIFVSYIFYGWWDWRFLSLIIFSSLIDYFVGIKIFQSTNKIIRKRLLFVSIAVNIGFLGFFKYFNFFVENFSSAFTLFGQKLEMSTLSIILPVGISFYTFQTLSYSIDLYRNKMKPAEDVFSFFAFVSFFPQLVAGPIERATNLLPQFYSKRSFDYSKATDGMRQILWGLFKKMVIADNCAIYVNDIFANYTSYSGSTLLIGSFFFALQIYGDFSGYSDIAIGTAKLFGFQLMRNFAFPYFSRDIAEFWRRWHISLSTWFRDYLYIPLGGSKSGAWQKIRNTFIIFIVSGFWHGANWTFIAWGFINALYFLPLLLMKKNRSNLNNVAEGRIFPSLKEWIQILVTFSLTLIAWVFFRSPSLYDAIIYLSSMFSPTLFNSPEIMPLSLFGLIFVFIGFEWFQRDKEHALQIENLKGKLYLNWSLYYIIILTIFYFGGTRQEFIYFQF